MAPTTSLQPRSGPVIAVVGSLNVDLVTRTARVPGGGETLTSSSFDIGFGGKGANQAVACARLSRPKTATNSHEQASTSSAGGQAGLVDVRMYGAIGTDQFAAGYLKALVADGVDVKGVRSLEGQKTGVAVIIVEEDTGENRILVHPGANHAVKADGLVPSWHDIQVALFQLEIPFDTVLQTIQDAVEHRVETILNPAPAIPLPSSIYPSVSHLILNESEAAILSKRSTTDIDIRHPSNLASIFHYFISQGVKCIIITLGAQGVVYQTSYQQQAGLSYKHLPARSVKVVDTTAAGDTFVGAYAVAWAISGADVNEDFGARVDFAVSKANEAASLTVQKEGAQSAIPWMDEISGGMAKTN